MNNGRGICNSRHSRGTQDLLDFGREKETAVMKDVVEGFYAEAIAGAEQTLPRVIPNGEGPHAVKMLQAFFAPLHICAENYFGIRVATERDTGLLQFLADFL